MKKQLPKLILLTVVAVGGFLGYKEYHYSQTHEDTDNAQIESYFVPVLPRTSGYVKSISVKDYDVVKKDQLLIEIDSEEGKLALEELKADLLQAETDVENAKANIQNLKMSIAAMEANLKATAIRRDKAKRDADRDNALVADNAITKKQAEDSRSNYDVLVAQYNASVQDIASNKSKMGILTAALHKAEATLAVKKVKIAQQELKLSYAKVYAPSEGRIGKKTVEAGQFIQAGQTLMTVVQDQQFWVVANFKENQIARLKVGDETELTLDAYPNRPLKGKIISISESTGAKASLLPPDNASGNFVKVTQRVPVKIEIEDIAKNKDILRAGLSLEVSVPVK
ncbi:HlyD family secretion protein [Flectobacillus roseus]|uniref:HlyD family secretion protein n=1 Tax=Flectobacillus roseus TaxID=502259 RepID=A0ABT6Y4L3_9BACT|nr:HlyD family secretion protein [Flectobacillus roseus]MDI9858495.1 HlyD family secretion protein [Flectobacillus roseus]MDI9870375.1 HlyD family secretion protein [Flectobacillus roseus]